MLNAALNDAQSCLTNGDGLRALQIIQDAIRIAPSNAALHTALGVALRFLGKLEEAAAAFVQAISLEPGKADAQVYLGMIRLAQGRQKEGWPLYQARWRNVHWPDKLRYPENTLWNGKISSGMRLLLWSEQGFGDAIQFARYVPWLARRMRSHGASLALEVPSSLCKLFRDSWPFIDIFAKGETRGRFDAHLPLMDLPLRWGSLVGEGGLPYLPMPIPYLTALPDLLVEKRGAVLVPSAISNKSKPLRVGIAWQGRPTHPDDHIRSIAPDLLQALFAVPDVHWVSLQKDATQHPEWLPQDMNTCENFSDTARIVDGLDLVISIDSSVAHLAGALNKSVWLLLPKTPDWRWQLSGEETPWYPSLRLFRQGSTEDWEPVISRVSESLSALTSTKITH